ncbi:MULTISPECIES: Lrp/AsnC family transcriptional regulator [Chryseobacterium]|jgi:Lrp/AsnC family leucine-responsive transcriptional regulator|uniref:Lrp/AsnC family transcriptional regulator n=1 Tax=Chryseobacterium rhizosphaerae TaxID=395937 RepID=A0ABX9IEH4_9FLAO|nr:MULTISPECIES: Lrp/AsnC family transcriptional regulator [Chryseobacterium]MDC8101053.1 Lrp/AsnC family transcriptional regulator [Chryseobacterium rhizosphaerae]MDR6545269.1 Lrp/AsnC family leucine-responsive transcriptional regulator [Chryseobacterium rhizosphaerae]REC70590.1 Lrp/AsnC family transcriptional regulator [Chryseobacterium rhizosphaerae]SMC67070.1 Lrp/AsnC family transcriptional regulator, leucine-responsive regulatory protein [Chryseobacterium sp. YR221]GEN65525.1 AsnC family 
MELDETDKKLLLFLQEDCKQTTKELSGKLGLSVTAVYERVKKLENAGVISKYVALLDRNKIHRNFIVLCHVKLIQHKKEFVLQFEKEVMNLEEVTECFHVSGDYDYILKIGVRDIEDYRSFMLTKLTTLQHIASTHSSFMISEVKNTTAIIL